MIIQCPNCHFSGRVPGYVAAVPHHARCPKCQFRFDIGDQALQGSESITANGQRDLDRALAQPRLDPSASSYAIEALTDDWSDDHDRSDRPSPLVDRPEQADLAGPTPSWRVPLFQAWATAFIIWALLIGARAILATLTRADDLIFSKELFWAVASVVLLVSGSAGLLLSLDLSRRLAGRQQPWPVVSSRNVRSLPPSTNGSPERHDGPGEGTR